MSEFEVFKDSRSEFRFRLKADTGETVATGEGYTSREDAHRGAEAARRAATSAAVVDFD